MNELEPWYEAAFGRDYVHVYPHRSLAAAREEARYLSAAGLRGRVLDLCCGYGRHTLALVELGFDAFGVDFSADLLAHARTLEGGALLRGRLVRADARRLPLPASSVDGVVNLFSSFGYFGDSEDAIVLDEVARILRPGGLLVLDLMNPARVRRTLVAASELERNGMHVEERRSLGSDGKQVIKHVRLLRCDGTVRTWTETVRLYERAEIERLLPVRGFTLIEVHGDFDGSDVAPDSPRQIFIARKAEVRSGLRPL